MYKHIPNAVTLLASFFGVLATSFAFQGNLYWAAYCILIAAFFDFVDGLLARALNAKSILGADLDSLADVVSFGVAPAAIAYQLMINLLPEKFSVLAYCAFIIVPFSVLRLAIFNNSTNQTTSFVGIPVPAHAMFWVGLVFLRSSSFSWVEVLYSPILLILYAVAFSLLLVSKLPFFGLKFSKDNKIHKNKMLWLFFTASIFLVFIFKWGALSIIIILYVSSAIFTYLKRKFIS